jgi:acyl-CoA synthetase (AMP-forming)/AMP-acid ligase II
MFSSKNHGKRLVAALIDSHAVNDPGRVWASVPQNDKDVSKGFVDLTYKQFANAINHASWWLKETLDGERGPFDTLAYAGPKDLRYPIIAVAAVKVGKQVC